MTKPQTTKHDIQQCLKDNMRVAINDYLKHVDCTAFSMPDRGYFFIYGTKEQVQEFAKEIK